MPFSYFFLNPYTWTNMDLDSQDNVHVTYGGIDLSLKYVFYDWQTWQEETIVQSWPYATSLKVDRNDRPRVAIGLNDLEFYTRENNQWTAEMIDDQVSVDWHASLQFDQFNYPQVALQGIPHGVGGGDALMYYRYWPGSPRIVLPETSHDFGTVWTQSYSDWPCPITNTGQGPLIISQATFQPALSSFQIVKTSLPLYILPQDTGFITVRFQPALEQSYSTALNIQSNDTLTPSVSVGLQGQGTASGTTGDLQLAVKNRYIKQEHGIFGDDLPLPDAQVSLFRNSQLIAGPSLTGQNGSVTFNNIPTGDLDLKIERSITVPDQALPEPVILNKTITLGPGLNSLTVVFPESLIVYKYRLIHELQNIPTDGFGIPFTFSYQDSENRVKDLLHTWNPNLPEDTAENLARLILVEQMIQELFNDGYSIGKEADT